MWPFTNWKAKYERLRKENDMYRERNVQLEIQVKKLKDTELIVRCQKMYIEDDEAIIEILDAAKQIDSFISAKPGAVIRTKSSAQQRMNAGMRNAGNFGTTNIY